MAKPTTAVDICNLALDRLGQDEIGSIDSPQTPAEDICARNYIPTLREMLRRFIFNFSRKYAVLTKDAGFTPAFGFDAGYPLPNDFIRLMALGDVTIKADLKGDLYDISENRILTSFGENDGSLKIQYVFENRQVPQYDPLFVRVFVLHLAANMAYKFSLKNTLINSIRDDAADAAQAAAAVAGQEKPPRRIQRSCLRDVRRFGSLTRDNSRV